LRAVAQASTPSMTVPHAQCQLSLAFTKTGHGITASWLFLSGVEHPQAITH